MKDEKDKSFCEVKPPNFLCRWSEFFIKNYKITILLLITMLIAGVWGLSNNQRQDFPTIESNFVNINARYPGATASDIEREIINPIESAISSLDINVKNVRSNATNHAGFIMVELENIDGAKDDAAKISESVDGLIFPQDVEVSTELLEVMGPTIAYALYSDELSRHDLLEKAPDIAEYLKGASPEIKKVDVIPDPKTKIDITLDAKKVSDLKLTQEVITGSIKSYINTLPGGIITTQENLNKPINIVAPVSSLDDIKDISIGPVKLSDIAEVKRSIAASDSLTYAGFLEDGEPISKNSVYLMVYKTKKGDIINISEKADEAIGKVYEKNVTSENVKIAKVYDTTPAIRDQISTLAKNGIIGLVLILVVLMFFINLRTGLVVALIIPLAFLLTLFILPLIGFTINILTLFAMILTLGILVDNAIVIAEGMVHHIEKGMNKLKAAVQAVKELGPAVTVATLTTFIVFVPFASMSGIMGEIMKYIPYTVMTMIAASYFLAITITPLLGRWILKQETKEERHSKKLKSWQKILVIPAIVFYVQRFVDHLVEKYTKLMKRIISKSSLRWTVIGITIVLLIASVGGAGTKLKFESFPTNDSNVITVSIEHPPGTSLEIKEGLAQEVGKEISELPYFESYFVFENSVTALFKEPKDRADKMTIHEINDKLEERLKSIRETLKPNTFVKSSSATYGPSDSKFDLTVEFTSDDDEALKKATNELEKHIHGYDYIDRISNSNKDELVSSVEVSFKKDELDRLQINPFLASQAVNAFFSQSEAGSVSIKEDGTTEKLYVIYPEESKKSIDDVKNVLIPTAQGAPVKLDSVSEISEVERLESIGHLNNKRASSLRVKLDEGQDKQAFEAKIKEFLNEDKLKEFGLSQEDLSFGGFAASLNEDYSNLQIVFILAIIFIFIVLVYQFRSYGQPFLIMITIPLAFIGILPGLKLVGGSMNMISGLGIVAVVGIVVNDAIVFIDYMNRFRKENRKSNLADVLVKTGEARMKPILSTSLTTIFGVLPITIVDPFWTGLGTSIVSGLVLSTIGTLIVVPVIAYTFSRKKNRGALVK